MEALADELIVGELMRALRLMFGQDAVPAPLAHHVTRWGSDPHAGGSWTYHAVRSGARDCEALAAPLGRYSGDCARVRFAGEHTSADDIGTVHGAWLSGEREALAILEDWADQECGRVGAGAGAEAEAVSLRARAIEVERLREENEGDSSCSSDDDD